MKPIKQSVINTFNRVGIDYKLFMDTEKVEVCNRFGGGCCKTTPFVRYLIEWVYARNNEYEAGKMSCTMADFDRIRHFILYLDSNAYMTCID